jgi:hypothetical protein
MQFIPSTWRAFGMGGDVRDPHDAILGAANYLRSSGAPRNYRRALFAYNPSSLYVNSVLAYARRMARSPRRLLPLLQLAGLRAHDRRRRPPPDRPRPGPLARGPRSARPTPTTMKADEQLSR